MPQFFRVVFGGLFAIVLGVFVAHLIRLGWWALQPQLASLHIPEFSNMAAAVLPKPIDGTSISGFARTVRYTADEEEDLINSAALSLPHAADRKVTASAYVVKDLASGETPIELNADTIMPIASLTKLVTAIVARRLIDTNERITLNKSIMATYGNTAQFKVGETFTAHDLLYPLLMVSSNDAAEAFAQDYGRKKFIQSMNAFTQSIGAYRTYFDDPSGLSANNVSTANDLVLILKWIQENDPEIIQLTALKSKTVRAHIWVNPTHFLNWSSYLGGKNGYTPEANRTAASLFRLGERKRTYAVIVLGSDARDADELKLIGKVR